MDRESFLEKLSDLLQIEDEGDMITFDTVLNELDEWDSLSKMAVIAFLNKEFNVKISFTDLSQIVVVEDIAKKVGL